MKIKIISFTSNGYELSKRIKNLLKTYDIQIFAKDKFIKEEDKNIVLSSSYEEFVRENFKKDNALIFIGATGIAVRAIAKYIKDKFSDPAIICIDEKANFIIPLLSGHIGGANDLANILASKLNAINVITTATDINSKWAVDIFAKKNNLFISNRVLAKDISARILAGDKIYIKSDFDISSTNEDICILSENDINTKVDIYITYKDYSENDKYKNTLFLVPKSLCLGIGCKRDTSSSKVIEFFNDFIFNNNIFKEAIALIASIDLKKDEEAIHNLAKYLDLDKRFFTANELNSLSGNFSASDFVYKITGVDCVCERACTKVYEDRIIDKISYEGVTMALSLDKTLKFEIR